MSSGAGTKITNSDTSIRLESFPDSLGGYISTGKSESMRVIRVASQIVGRLVDWDINSLRKLG